MNTAPTQADLLRDFLLAHPGRWVSMPRLARVMGGFAVHSRIAQLRTESSMVIVNRQRRHDGIRMSFYRYQPPTTEVVA